MSFSGLFGGGGGTSAPAESSYVDENGKQVIEGYEVADANDMEWLAGIL